MIEFMCSALGFLLGLLAYHVFLNDREHWIKLQERKVKTEERWRKLEGNDDEQE